MEPWLGVPSSILGTPSTDMVRTEGSDGEDERDEGRAAWATGRRG